MSSQGPCPAATDWQRLLSQLLPPEAEQLLVTHLEQCPACRTTFEALAGSTRAAPAGHTPLAAATKPPGLAQAMQTLKSAPPMELAAPAGSCAVTALLAPAASADSLGRLGPYELLAVVGQGAFGTVFKAIEPALNRLVALKVLAPHFAHSAAARLRFAREARAAAAVRHPHVVAIHGVDEAAGLPYLVMEYIAGASLQQRLDEDGALPLPVILRIGAQIAEGLAAAHAQGLVHRDIKPANILLDGNVEHVKITDFGLARAADDASMTQSGVIAGTPQYMAPEQSRGEVLDQRADLFSLGSVLYASATGRPPFRAETTLALLRRISEDEPRPVREINPELPPWLADVITVLMAKDPADRFQSAAEVAEVLRGLLAHLQQPGPRPRLPNRRPRPRRRLVRVRRAALVLVLACVSLAAALAVYRLERFSTGAPPAPPMRMAALPLLDDPAPLRAALAQHGPFMNLSVGADGNLLAVACQKGHCAHVWDLTTGRLLRSCRGHDFGVWSVALSRDGRLLATAAGDWDDRAQPGQVWLWDVATGQVLQRFAGHTQAALSVALSPDGQLVASAGLDHTVRFWDAATGNLRAVFEGHQGLVRSLAFHPDGKHVASGSFDGTVRLLDALTGQEVACLQPQLKAINRVTFSADGKTLAIAELGRPTEPPVNAAISRDEHEGLRRGLVELCDVPTWQARRTLTGFDGCVLGVAFAPDSKTVAGAGGRWGAGGEVRLWDAASGQELGHAELKSWRECVAFAPDGRTLITAGGTPHLGFAAQLVSWDVTPDARGWPLLRQLPPFARSLNPRPQGLPAQ